MVILVVMYCFNNQFSFNVGVVATDTTGVGTARQHAIACMWHMVVIKEYLVLVLEWCLLIHGND